jgi:hypothetical protein
MISGEISIVAANQRIMALELEALATRIRDSCRLDEPEGIHKVDEPAYSPESKSLIATFTVLPEYQEGDIDKLFGCCPDMQYPE